MGNDITRNETIRTRLSERTSSPMLPKPVEDIVSVKTGHAACYMKCILLCYLQVRFYTIIVTIGIKNFSNCCALSFSRACKFEKILSPLTDYSENVFKP